MKNAWIYDLPKIGPFLRNRKNQKVFDSVYAGEIAIDLGANVGKITEKLAKRGAIVYAFEPDPSAYQALLKKVARYNHRVHCYNVAVSDHNGYARLYFHVNAKENPEKWSVASSLVKEKGNVDQSHFVETELIDIGEFIQKLDKPIKLLKVDIEGAEIEVLNHLIDLGLHKKIHQIVVETHERVLALVGPTAILRKRINDLGITNIDTNWQ